LQQQPVIGTGGAASQEIAMFSLTELSRNAQRVVCMLLSAVIVTASLSFGAFEAQSAMHEGYSVTITQLPTE
jgi:hypothetical protein